MMKGKLGLIEHSWGSETVVYNSLSGEVHLLNDLAAEALSVLRRQAADAQTLTSHVAETFSLVPDSELGEHMERLLWEFDELGLIESTDP